VAIVGIVVGIAGCNGTKQAADVSSVQPAPAPTVTVTEHAKTAHHVAHHAVKAQPATQSSSKTSGSGAASGWVMPNLVGTDLQSAQDAIQSVTDDGIWYTHSHDATGAGRMQLWDRDWKVCSQNVAPGASIHSGTSITFDVVKRDSETCP
jgi:hypothetical protein